MRLPNITGIAVAAFVAAAPVAFAQTSSSTQTPTKTPAQTAAQADMKTGATTAIQTFTGCLMTEPAYRAAHNLGKGAANGLGLGDEFVLVDAKISPAKATTDMKTDMNMNARSSVTPAASPAGTCADQGMAYRLTGTAEEKIKGLVGHQLEVQGKFKHADDVTAAGTQEGSKLPAEVEIVSFQEAPAPAPAPAATPAPAMTEPARPATPPASTVEPMRATPPPAPTPEPATTEPKELPHTASSTYMLALFGVVALSAGVLMTLFRRRTA